MRAMAVKSLKAHWEDFPKPEQAGSSWYQEASVAEWSKPNEPNAQFNNTSILTDKGVVINIHGNT